MTTPATEQVQPIMVANKQKKTSSENEFFKLLGSRIMITRRKPNGTKVLYVFFPRPVTKVTKLQFINNEE